MVLRSCSDDEAILHSTPTLILITDVSSTLIFFKTLASQKNSFFLNVCNHEEKALFFLKKDKAAVIIIDEETSSINLKTFCQKIRKITNHLYTPILIITNRLKKSFIRTLLKAGATDFLNKPLEKEEVFLRIEIGTKIKNTEEKIANLPQLNLLNTHFETTSLKDKSLLDPLAVKLISNALKEKSPLSLLILEIDQKEKFQLIKGKEKTDQLLVAFEHFLEPLMRKQDFLFSQKQETFIILLPNTSPKGARFIAENIQEALETYPFSVGSSHLYLTMSMGLASLSQGKLGVKNSSFSFNKLLETAQFFLEQAKKKGNTIMSNPSK